MIYVSFWFVRTKHVINNERWVFGSNAFLIDVLISFVLGDHNGSLHDVFLTQKMTEKNYIDL